jgi:hypothetical protein
VLGNLYVAAKYWAYGYSDGMANAGGSKRRKVVIGEEVFWAKDRDLPALLESLLTKPEEAPQAPREARKRARKRAKASEAIPITKIAQVAPERRPAALESVFEAVGEEVLLYSLQVALSNLAEQDDEEVLLLLT